MSRKEVHYTVLSDKKCKMCKRRLKQNLVDTHPDATLCFRDFRKDKPMATASEVRSGRMPGRAKGRYASGKKK